MVRIRFLSTLKWGYIEQEREHTRTTEMGLYMYIHILKAW